MTHPSTVTPVQNQPKVNTQTQTQQVFGFLDHASLWFSLGVGLLVIQMGAYLFPAVGTQNALFAIILGSILGSAFLAYVAQLGCNTGLTSAGLMQRVYGTQFVKLPVIFNVIQLFGWAAFELVVMRDGLTAIIEKAFDVHAAYLPIIVTLLFGLLLYALARASMVGLVRRVVARVGLPLVLLSLVWLTIQFVKRILGADGGFDTFWNRTGTGEMSTVSAIDLVIAMPISWLPLVADYSRFGKRTQANGQASKSAFTGTWLGYVLANIWCYGLGLVVVSTLDADVDLINTLLLSQFGLLALTFILIDEMDNAYGDMYSGSVSLNHLLSGFSVNKWGKLFTIVAVLSAIVLPMHSLEPFLLILSSIFVPLFGVIAVRMTFSLHKDESEVTIRWPNAVIWALGIAVYYVSPIYFPDMGASLPSLVFTIVVSAILPRKY